jgi:hypothetical protein
MRGSPGATEAISARSGVDGRYSAAKGAGAVTPHMVCDVIRRGKQCNANMSWRADDRI